MPELYHIRFLFSILFLRVMRLDKQVLPPQYAIDYVWLSKSAKAGTIPALIIYLRRLLPMKWQRVYTAAVSHTPNIIPVEYGTFDYICDSYSGMEALGEIAFDQRVRDRGCRSSGTLSTDARSTAKFAAKGLGGTS